jgi:pimeloyl-ACP methyl ester carboxylesterase
MPADGVRHEDIFFVVRDGLKLHARKYPAQAQPHVQRLRPVVCLPGLTRNGRDFHDLALALSQGSDARSVYTLDYRGRGLSDHDKDWRNYNVPMEMRDVTDFMTACGLHDAAIVGTSRGGLITMVMAAAQPGLIGAAVLNDIGPVIETKGLSRIAAYVGRMPVPRSWPEAAKLVSDLNAKAFPALSEADWEPIARQFFNERNGRPVAGYDPALGRAFSVLDGPMPAMWAQFDALKNVPVMVIRGEKSDLLSQETVDAMRLRHPNFKALTVPGQGHAPFLRDDPTQTAIRQFFNAAEPARAPALLTLV